MATNLPLGHHSKPAHWAAYLAMKQAGGDHNEAKWVYGLLMPEEPVARWKEFANRCWQKLDPDQRARGAVLPGPKPLIPDELALKIGTVYAQRLVWEHGKYRPYRDMDEVSCKLLPVRPPAPSAPAVKPWLPPSRPLACPPNPATGVPAAPCAEGPLQSTWHQPRVPAVPCKEGGRRLPMGAGPHQAAVQGARAGGAA